MVSSAVISTPFRGGVHFDNSGSNAARFSDEVGDEATIEFESGSDSATFDGNINAASILGGGGEDAFHFSNIQLAGSTIFGGDANDNFSGGITVGASDVSFWGGAGADTFSFDTFTGSAGSTAYFWNDQAGTDAITFGDAISSALGVGAFFGLTLGSSASGLDISFAGTQGSENFGSDGLSSLFAIGAGQSQLVTFGFDSGESNITLIYAGGQSITLSGGDFSSAAGTNVFGNPGATS